MDNISHSKKNIVGLLIGDTITVLMVTIAGFVSHGTLLTAGSRVLATFIPLLAAWLFIAPFVGLYDIKKTGNPKSLWRPIYAMIVAAPFAAWLRGLILSAPIMPVFVAVMVAVGALGIFLWRAIYYFIQTRS